MSSVRHEWVVDTTSGGKRLDLSIGEKLDLSRGQLKALFESEAVWVNHRRAKKGQTVEAGQRICVMLPQQAALDVTPEPSLPLRVLHETAELVFLDKPSGQPTHPLRAGETGTLANALVARFPECSQASEEAREGGFCHRLDVETSGVILAAKNRSAWTQVRQAFTAQGVDKRYWALVAGPLADEGEIDVPLRHHPRHADRVQPALPNETGSRPAHSHFRVLSRHHEFSLVEVRIFTGVLHQVRAHLAAVGAPIVGDDLYGGQPLEHLNRFFLHAQTLSLDFGQPPETFTVQSPLPLELESALKQLGLTIPPSP